jgi:hypothetical protein
MPTADTYWSAAADFARLAESVAAEIGPVQDGLSDDVVRGGRLRARLDEAVADIVAGLGATADGYDTLAAECRRRARACEAYTAALAASIGTGAPPPPREPWMAAG